MGQTESPRGSGSSGGGRGRCQQRRVWVSAGPSTEPREAFVLPPNVSRPVMPAPVKASAWALHRFGRVVCGTCHRCARRGPAPPAAVSGVPGGCRPCCPHPSRLLIRAHSARRCHPTPRGTRLPSACSCASCVICPSRPPPRSVSDGYLRRPCEILWPQHIKMHFSIPWPHALWTRSSVLLQKATTCSDGPCAFSWAPEQTCL